MHGKTKNKTNLSPDKIQYSFLIIDLKFKVFPPRLKWQPIFYPVLNREYAVQIAERWNTKDEFSGYCGIVTQFELPADYLQKYEIHNVGGFINNELWVPAESLDEFNKQIQGTIKIVDVFLGESFNVAVSDEATLLVLNYK